MIPRRGRIWLTGETEFETDDGEIRRVGPATLCSPKPLGEGHISRHLAEE
jgi:hypothetical protein